MENGGTISHYYLPQTTHELIDICGEFYRTGKKFDIVGHTSNIYFLPDYHVDNMVSTRNLKHFEIVGDVLSVECGVSVRLLAQQMTEKGYEGFEGLIDLPGTVGAAIYGNAGCYNCSLNEMLIDCDLLTPKCEIVKLEKHDLKIGKRTTVLKSGEAKGIVISARLRLKSGDAEFLKKRAKQYHAHRIQTQPGPKDNLGSIYSAESESPTLFGYSLMAIAKVYTSICSLWIKDEDRLKQKKKDCLFALLFAKKLKPYIYGWTWNRFVWKDKNAHSLFWKYNRLHRRLFKNNDFEIVIKGNKAQQ